MMKYMPIDISAHGAELDRLLVLVHYLMFVLAIGWAAYFFYVLFRFRKSRNPKADYTGVKSHVNSYLEVGVAAVEALLLFGLAVPLWSKVVDKFPDETQSVVVRVIGEQFAWNIHYPGADGVFGLMDTNLIASDNPLGLDREEDPNAADDIVTLNQMVIPVNKDVIVHLSSKDVIHCFALQQLRVKQDLIPGMRIPSHFKSTRTSAQVRETMTSVYKVGMDKIPNNRVAMEDIKDKNGNVVVRALAILSEPNVQKLKDAGITEIRAGPQYPLEIACAQLCGLGHYRMRGFLTILEQDEYDKWLEEQAAELE